MARAATTTDVYNAVAEERRRAILDELAAGECGVSELVDRLHFTQPAVSKHLRVLREVGLVTVRQVGRERLYRAYTPPLQVIHEWIRGFETTWTDRFRHFDEVLDELKDKESSDDHS